MADETVLVEEEEREEAIDAGESKPWLDMLKQAEKAFSAYQDKSDNIDKLYADLGRMAAAGRDREMAIFWANIQVLGPSIYSRPPVPVVVPRFKDRRPVPRVASELLERATIVSFEMEDIDQVMRLIRDDVNILARGVAWVYFEEKDGKKRVCISHKDRRDFLHDPARNWKEVGWVAGAAYMTEGEMEERFQASSGDAYKDAVYEVQKDAKNKGAADDRQKAKVWEIWSKSENKVVWVTEGCDVVLDEGEPHLSLEGFFPCPKPAYATLQRGSLMPVPDFVFYKDQLEEINELTARIAALAESVRVRGFYPAGAGDIGDAIEAAINTLDNRKIMVPVSNFAAFGNGSAKDTIIWLPIDMIVETIASLVELRKQLIDDVYQITGLSDIMRGATDPNETLGAQELKSQYGSVRIRDKQAELVRIARDICRLVAEIMAENFDPKTLLEMTQMEIPSDADIREQEKGIIAQGQAQVKQALANPQIAQQAQQQPQMAQQMLDQLEQRIQAQIAKLKETPTVEQVMDLLREQRLRPFVLDIETDSTIQPNEDAEKQRRAEFMTALGGVMQQLAPMVASEPQSAGFAGEVLKFALAPFRAGRELEQSIDEFVEQMKAQAGKPRPNPEAEKAKAEMEMRKAELQMKQQEAQTKAQAEQEKMQADMAAKQMDMRARQAEAQAKLQESEQKRQSDAEKHAQEMEKGGLELQKLQMEIERIQAQGVLDQQKAALDATQAYQDADLAERADERQAQSAEQQADLAERKAAMADG